MQIVFVHGVSTRDFQDGGYQNWVEDRKDRLNRLAFGGKAQIDNPYWGKFGLQERQLKSMPLAKKRAEPPSMGTRGTQQPMRRSRSASAVPDALVMMAKENFAETVASMSVAAIADATVTKSVEDRHRIEDFWVGAAGYADSNPPPNWLAGISSTPELMEHLNRAVALEGTDGSNSGGRRHRGSSVPDWIKFDPNALLVGKAREMMEGYLAQFLGDALMFFSRREQSELVRSEVRKSVVAAAELAHERREPLVLIGYSMGGGVVHELLTDPASVEIIEQELGRRLEIDLMLSVGTQIGMFAELKQFITPPAGNPLSVPVRHYWNVFDYNDPLSFLCEPVIDGAIDLEVSTGASIMGAHGAYFESGLFYSRLHAMLKDAGLA